ncbi:hypothetical protein SteCoe_26056 [Stentor coeruleus]|uniref:Uncharacterized protein n=1 Tax=Stentor coeruleus TaxID=5963 RepID=A0A1R2BDS0_9CILI|nr:hypothetical protein SteCoe_26056 [Stentor coeruleus]
MIRQYKSLDKRLYIFKDDIRKRKPETIVMKKFKSLKESESHPKKEYVRCKVIRGHKKLIRSIIDSKLPVKGIAKFNNKDKNQLYYYRLFQDQYADNIQQLDLVSKTDAGPLTDGKSKRPNQKKGKDTESSFNNTFCREYFSTQAVKESFFIFIELIFSDFNPEELKKKFGFKCCQMTIHTLVCYDKWMVLKFYLQDEIFKTLEIDKPEGNFELCNKLPSIAAIGELDGIDLEVNDETMADLESAIHPIKIEEEKTIKI